MVARYPDRILFMLWLLSVISIIVIVLINSQTRLKNALFFLAWYNPDLLEKKSKKACIQLFLPFTLSTGMLLFLIYYSYLDPANIWLKLKYVQ